jgi:hypothetical protein
VPAQAPAADDAVHERPGVDVDEYDFGEADRP